MNILLLNHNQENFGTYFRCLYLAKGLSALGHRVTMICASGRRFDLCIRRQRINERCTIITLPRVTYHRYFTGQIELRLPLTILFVLFLRYDICHAFTVAQPQIGIPAWIAKKVRRKTLIVDWDDLWGGGFADYHRWPINRILAFFETNIPRVADHITYVSEYLGSRIHALGLERCATKIPNGADPEKVKPIDTMTARTRLRLSPEKKYLVAMGNTYLDSFVILLKAVTRVAERDPNVHLILVGAVSIPEYLRSIFEPIQHHVTLTGFRPLEEVTLYLGAADVLLLPMDDNPIEKARFPIRFGDYLCAGRPIVSNAVGEIQHYLETYHCGRTCGVNNIDDMADAILHILNDAEGAASLGVRAREVAEHVLPWNTIVSDLDHVYTDVAERAQRCGVIILSPFFEPNTGGVETHLRDLSRYLQKRGHTISVLTYQPLTTDAWGPFIERRDSYFVIHRVPWVGHNLFHQFERHPVLQFLYLTPVLLTYTFFFLLLHRKKYAAIHAHGLTAALIAHIMYRVFGIQFVVSMHAIYGFRRGWWLSRVCRLILFPAKKVFCLAETSRQDLLTIGLPPSKLTTYVQWVDQDNFQPRDRETCRRALKLPSVFTVLFVGRLLEKKGVRVLLAAAERIGENALFVFIGDGPMVPAVEKAAATLGNVRVIGKKEQDEVALYYGACNVVTVPSQYEEGFARVVLETLSSGRTIIAAARGCLPEMIAPDVGILIEPTVSNFVEAITALLENPQRARQLESRCRQYALEHFGEEHARPIEESYFV